MHRIRAPSLVLWGSDDKIAPATLAARWTSDRSAVTVNNAGHLLEWDAPELVAEELRAFIES
ncbi:MAG: alpha/beta hydrolase [Actinobacteria bacterium]|nr:MAG: alpha/beta hydrolase [Actinomycetota bacterium]